MYSLNGRNEIPEGPDAGAHKRKFRITLKDDKNKSWIKRHMYR